MSNLNQIPASFIEKLEKEELILVKGGKGAITVKVVNNGGVCHGDATNNGGVCYPSSSTGRK